MVAVCYHSPLFPCFWRFASCQCNSFESFFFLPACIQVSVMLFRVFKCLHIDLFMKGEKAEIGSSPEECHRSTAAGSKLICWLAEDYICNINASTYWIFSVRGLNLSGKKYNSQQRTIVYGGNLFRLSAQYMFIIMVKWQNLMLDPKYLLTNALLGLL